MTSQTEPQRYALIGTGARSQMYLAALARTHSDVGRLELWADTNPGRLELSSHHFAADGAPADDGAASHHGVARLPETVAPADFAAEVARRGITKVIITTPDFTHARLAVEALDAGADVIIEKPLTIDADGVRAISEAVERAGRSVTVTFNYRYSPRNAALKALIASGEIGEVTSVHFEWVLDTAHGADYFRRWHREKKNSGGLLVHKSTHHFDLVNWWLDDAPRRVFASGGLRFYGPENAAARGLGERPERGTTDSPLRDAFSLDLRADATLKGLYLDSEHHDGYLRDRDVFTGPITIEDNLSLVVDYQRGPTMSYSLNAHSPWEGYSVHVNGTKGRAELHVVERGAVLLDGEGRAVIDPSAQPDGVTPDTSRPVGERLTVQHHFGPLREVEIPEGVGGHGGGDDVLLADLFRGDADDPLGRRASWADGVRSLAVGLAGNRSLETDLPVLTADLDLGPARSVLEVDAR